MASTLSETDLERLKTASVLVVGAGALGVPVATHLTQAGTGRIGVVDSVRDRAERTPAGLGALNPEVQVDPYPAELDARNAKAIVAGHDLVLDCSGSPGTRALVNDACVAERAPLITAALDGLSGWVAITRPGEGACFSCVPEDLKAESTAREAPVIGAVAGLVGSIQALEAIGLLTAPRSPLDRLLEIDARAASIDTVAVARRAGCTACGAAMPALESVS